MNGFLILHFFDVCFVLIPERSIYAAIKCKILLVVIFIFINVRFKSHLVTR